MNEYLKKRNNYLKDKNIDFNPKTKKYEKGGISESRLINNNSNIQTIMNILKCKICKNILLNPYDCSKCGNTFCFNCINKIKENSLSCPFNCQLFEIIPSSFGIKKFLNQLKFECKNKSKGCKEIIPYKEIENHEKICPYNIIICPNVECKQKIKSIELENHIQNECKFTLFKCKNCGLNLNKKEILLHDKICYQIKEQLNSQSPLINDLTKEEYVQNNKQFNSFINILNGLNEDYFYLFDNDKNNNYYYNYSNKGLITLIKCLISLFQYKFGIIEKILNDISNNIKKVKYESSNLITKNNTSFLDYTNKNSINKYNNNDKNRIINNKKINKINSYNKEFKTQKKIFIKNQNNNIENYNSEDYKKKWETISLEKSKIKQKIILNNLYNKEKSFEFFHSRQKSNEINDKRFEFNNNIIKNELFFLGGNNNNHKNKIPRNKSDMRQNMTFTNFIINKKKDIEQKILGNRLNKSSTDYYNNLNHLNNSDSFKKSNIDYSYGFYLNSVENEKNIINLNKSFGNIRNNIYEKKIFKSILPIYKGEKMK